MANTITKRPRSASVSLLSSSSSPTALLRAAADEYIDDYTSKRPRPNDSLSLGVTAQVCLVANTTDDTRPSLPPSPRLQNDQNKANVTDMEWESRKRREFIIGIWWMLFCGSLQQSVIEKRAPYILAAASTNWSRY